MLLPFQNSIPFLTFARLLSIDRQNELLRQKQLNIPLYHYGLQF